MTSTCNTCIYLHRFSNTEGQCRRHTPAAYGSDTAWPTVQTHEAWCGEYSGNTQPLSASEYKAFIDPNLMPGVVSVKPTPYRKDPST